MAKKKKIAMAEIIIVKANYDRIAVLALLIPLSYAVLTCIKVSTQGPNLDQVSSASYFFDKLL